MSAPTPEHLAELRRIAELANDLPGGSDWLHGEVADGTETVAEWMDKCSATPDAPAAGLLHVVWSEGVGEKRVTVQAIVGDTETAPIRAAFIANANPAAVLALLDAAAERDDLAAALRCREEQVTRRGAERDALAAKLTEVRALHQVYMCEECREDPSCGGCREAPSCEACDSMTYPCATIRALDATPETGGES